MIPVAEGTKSGRVSVHLDLSKLDANIARYTARVSEAGVALRAHIKGHRVPEITARQMKAGAIGVSLHSAAEAWAHARAGANNVVVAWPWRDSWRWPLFAELARECEVSVHVDGPAVLPGLAAAARAAKTRLGVRIEVDTGLRRSGVAPRDVAALARGVHDESSLRLDGVTGYVAINTAGEARRRFKLGRRCAELLVRAAGELRKDRLPCPVVSIGGTPTLAGALSVPGVTEVCCGTYALLDSGLAALGECRLEDVAVSLSAGDADLLAGGDQVWKPGVTMASAGGSTILPAHICPLVAKRPLLRVLRDGAQVAVWRALVEPDRH